MPDSTFPEVRSLDLFADMSDENYAKLMRGAYLQTFPPHVDLIGEEKMPIFSMSWYRAQLICFPVGATGRQAS